MAHTVNFLRTPLYEEHVHLQAKMMPFSDYQMPLHYGSSVAEHLAVRAQVGLFDVSHMGNLFVYGPAHHALDFLQRVTTNDVSKLREGTVQYTCLLNEEAKVLDDLLLYKMPTHEEAAYMLVVNAANVSSDHAWLMAQCRGLDVVVRDASHAWAILALQGPRADEILQRVSSSHKPLPNHTFAHRVLFNVPLFLSATGYTGSGGYELYVSADKAALLWRSLLAAGKAYGLQPVGLSARDSLRLEMGYCLYGNDIDRTTTPLEACLGWITKFNKGDFIGRTALLQQKKMGTQRCLVGFVMEEKSIPRAGYTLLSAEQQPIGKVTSGGFSPAMQQGIGMGYVTVAHRRADTPCYVSVRDTPRAARIVSFPIYKTTNNG